MKVEGRRVKSELPKGWTICNLEECVEILDSQRVPVNHKEIQNKLGEIPYYGATGQGDLEQFGFKLPCRF